MKINESQLRKIIKEAINELDWKTYANAAWKEDMINNNNWDDDNWKNDDSRARRFRQAAIDAFNREHGYQNGEEEYSMLYNRDETFDGITPAVYDAKYGEPDEYDATKQTPSWEQNPERYTRGHMFDVYSTNGAESANHLKHKYYGNRKKHMFSPKDPIPKNYSADLKQAIIDGNREISRYVNGDYDYTSGKGWHLKESQLRKIIKESVKKVLKEYNSTFMSSTERSAQEFIDAFNSYEPEKSDFRTMERAMNHMSAYDFVGVDKYQMDEIREINNTLRELGLNY